MVKTCGKLLILVLLTLAFSTIIAHAMPILESSDHVPWTQVPDLNEDHKGWTIFTRSVKSYVPLYVTITDINKTNINFEWKTDKVDDYIDVTFLINGNVHDSCRSTNFTPINPFIVQQGDELEFKLWVRKSTDVNVWIAFPPQINKTSSPSLRVNEGTEQVGTIVYGKKSIECDDDLQEEINKSNSYTELILKCNKYNNSEIIIQGKNNITITSCERNSSGKAIIEFSDLCQHSMIKICDSNNIKLNCINLTGYNCKHGIIISNSSHIEIVNNILNFACCGNGIVLYSGHDNSIMDNEFRNTSENCADLVMSTDVAVLGAYNTYIAANNVQPIDDNFPVCHYRIMNGRPLNTTVVINNLQEIIELRLGACSCKWIGSYFRDCYEEGSASRLCNEHPDNDPDPYVWNY